MSNYLVGIDEAGRGPLAGPLAVGAVCVPVGYDLKQQFPTLTDSKKLAESERERLYDDLIDLRGRTPQVIWTSVTFIRPETIDRYGMTHVLRTGVKRALSRLAVPVTQCEVKLDGTLRAPAQYVQETIIGGDLSEPTISAASIIAKAARDRRMRRYARQFPSYGFDQHKGYGTKAHRAAIQKYGACEIHRKSYLNSILNTKH